MAFKASKTRQRKVKQIAEGNQLIPNAGVRDAYTKIISKFIQLMMDDYERELNRVFNHKDVEEFYSEDASTTVLFKRMLAKLDRKWRSAFSDFAKKHASIFAEKIDNYSKFTAKHSLKSLGIEDPKTGYSEKARASIQASIAENVSLITNIQETFAKEIEGVVYRSITSTNPEEQGSSAVFTFLREKGAMSKRRAQLIAEDQNSKLFTSLNAERMQDNGIEKFKWKHSSAGKYPRESHLRREKEDVGYGPGVFRLDSPELWEGPKADRGLPGEAIRCRCRMIPIINLD